MPNSMMCTEPPCDCLSYCFPCNTWGNVFAVETRAKVDVQSPLVTVCLHEHSGQPKKTPPRTRYSRPLINENFDENNAKKKKRTNVEGG